MEDINSSKFIVDLRNLIKVKSFYSYNYTLIVYDVEEVDLNEYCLSLALDNYIFKGIYTSTRFNIGEKINNSLIYIFKKNLDIKLYLKPAPIPDTENSEDKILNTIINEKQDLSNYNKID